jgi:hypothetical protein
MRLFNRLTAASALILRALLRLSEAGWRGRMGRFVVNFKPAGIFNGFFEMQKSAQSGEKFAESGTKKI